MLLGQFINRGRWYQTTLTVWWQGGGVAADVPGARPGRVGMKVPRSDLVGVGRGADDGERLRFAPGCSKLQGALQHGTVLF